MVDALERRRAWRPQPQDDALATFAPKIDRDSAADWCRGTRTAVEVALHLRAFDPVARRLVARVAAAR